MQNRSTCGFVVAAERRHGIITSNLPLQRLRVCKAHAPVLAHRALRTLNHAKPQHVRVLLGRFAARRDSMDEFTVTTPGLVYLKANKAFPADTEACGTG